MKYSEKLKDPRWQKKRLEILNRDEWACQKCFDTKSTLHVHHRRYLHGKNPWDYENELLITLCETCHEEEKISRPDAEHDLIEILKEKFLSDEIHEIAAGFLNLKLSHLPGVVASIIKFSLENYEIQNELRQKYFDSIKS